MQKVIMWSFWGIKSTHSPGKYCVCVCVLVKTPLHCTMLGAFLSCFGSSQELFGTFKHSKDFIPGFSIAPGAEPNIFRILRASLLGDANKSQSQVKVD